MGRWLNDIFQVSFKPWRDWNAWKQYNMLWALLVKKIQKIAKVILFSGIKTNSGLVTMFWKKKKKIFACQTCENLSTFPASNYNVTLSADHCRNSRCSFKETNIETKLKKQKTERLLAGRRTPWHQASLSTLNARAWTSCVGRKAVTQLFVCKAGE